MQCSRSQQENPPPGDGLPAVRDSMCLPVRQLRHRSVRSSARPPRPGGDDVPRDGNDGRPDAGSEGGATMTERESTATAGAPIGDAAVASFRAGLRGHLLRPADDGYDAARKLWNGMVDRRPALIARCAGAADVVRAVNFARDHARRPSPRRCRGCSSRRSVVRPAAWLLTRRRFRIAGCRTRPSSSRNGMTSRRPRGTSAGPATSGRRCSRSPVVVSM